jgi:hypothetical protein
MKNNYNTPSMVSKLVGLIPLRPFYVSLDDKLAGANFVRWESDPVVGSAEVK